MNGVALLLALFMVLELFVLVYQIHDSGRFMIQDDFKFVKSSGKSSGFFLVKFVSNSCPN